MGKGSSKRPASTRQRRIERQRREAASRAQHLRRRRVRNIAVFVVVIAVIATVTWYVFRPLPEVAGVERPPNRGRGHVPRTQIGYETAAPTSGAHLAAAPPCGPMSEMLDLGLAVHALEHGAVVVWYQPELEDKLRNPLLDILQNWDSHWILSPNPDIVQPIVATAWNRRKAFATGEGLDEFVDTYRRRGPEKRPCDV